MHIATQLSNIVNVRAFLFVSERNSTGLADLFINMSFSFHILNIIYY